MCSHGNSSCQSPRQAIASCHQAIISHRNTPGKSYAFQCGAVLLSLFITRALLMGPTFCCHNGT